MKRFFVLILFLLSSEVGVATAQTPKEYLGTNIRLELLNGSRLRGELLAVDSDSLFLAGDFGYQAISLADLSDARVPQSGLTGKHILIWSAIAGGVSALGLTLACNSVEDAACGQVFAVVGLSWVVVGGISAAINGPSTRAVDLAPSSLSPYARFPQGLPEDFSPYFGERR